MKLHKKKKHDLGAITTWGNRGDVALRVNFGVLSTDQDFPFDKPHYHTTRTTYFCVVSGSLKVEVAGELIIVTPEAMLEISPNIVYRTVGPGPDGCIFVVIGSHNNDDKVETV